MVIININTYYYMLYYFIMVDVHSLMNWEMKRKGIGLCLRKNEIEKQENNLL